VNAVFPAESRRPISIPVAFIWIASFWQLI
jgi:hypothetical protein